MWASETVGPWLDQWLGIWAEAVSSMGKTLWLAMRRRTRMLGVGSGSASSPTHHWDCGAKTWVARHSGKRGKGVGGGQHVAAVIRTMGWSAWFDADQRALSQASGRAVHSVRPVGSQASQDVRTRGARGRVSVGRGSDPRTGLGRLGLDRVGLPGRSWPGRLSWTLGRVWFKADQTIKGAVTSGYQRQFSWACMDVS